MHNVYFTKMFYQFQTFLLSIICFRFLNEFVVCLTKKKKTFMTPLKHNYSEITYKLCFVASLAWALCVDLSFPVGVAPGSVAHF